jgi:hypothetical protein
MKQRARIIQITGIRGILLVIFIASCLAAGFVGFPALVAVYGWNYLASQFAIPSINFLQGMLLWALIAGSIYLLNDKNKYLTSIKVKSPYQMTDDEFKKIIDSARLQSGARIIRSTQLTEEELKKMLTSGQNISNSTNPIQSNKNIEAQKPEELEHVDK